DGRWAMVYLGDKASFSLHMDKIGAGHKVKAQWIDPRTGVATDLGRHDSTRVKALAMPEGWEDALLVLE
ncbi:MAG TPA: putative collagen-binding domain-containing protein, partial [Candidatus Methylomirabilis sp.]|nr:putative collagen-binding domain-containing protein [Candidatus Methylomirabilis sp.]